MQKNKFGEPLKLEFINQINDKIWDQWNGAKKQLSFEIITFVRQKTLSGFGNELRDLSKYLIILRGFKRL